MFTQEQKTFLLECYFRNSRRLDNGNWDYSVDGCRQDFLARFQNTTLNSKTFSRDLMSIVQCFRDTGSVNHRRGAGRPLIRSDSVVLRARNAIQEQPTLSVRRLAQRLNVSTGTCHAVLTDNLTMHPYKLKMYQELLPTDYVKRMEYCQFFNQYLNNDDVLDKTFFTDEAWFHLTGYLNSQNMRIWSTENPHYFRETGLHPVKIGVWCAMSRRRVIGPIFFEGNINAERYRREIIDPFVNQLHDDELHTGYFQQDSARPHVANATISYLQEFFDNRLISINRFPPRSCDLTPLDYFLFPYLKNSVFSMRVETLDDLRDNIITQCRSVDGEMLRNVFQNMKKRIELCLSVNGEHFQHLL